MSEKTLGQRYFKIWLTLLYLLTTLVILYFLIVNWDFYNLPLKERIRHSSYQSLKPGGKISHGLGILGSGMMLLLLLYSLRKRVKLFKSWGNLSHWLNVHIYFGIMGPLFVILHTTFKLNGLVAVSFWSMIAVAVSGIFGRFIYVQIPRNLAGIELDREKALTLSAQLKHNIKTTYQLDEAEFLQLENELGLHFASGSFTRVFFSLLFVDLILFFKRPRIRKQLKQRFQISGTKINTLIQLTVQQAKLEQRIHFLTQIQQIFHYWHVIHKPFALLMYLIMFIHVGIAVWLGYTWF